MEIRVMYRGKAEAFRSLGFSEDQMKVAFVHDGLSTDQADALIKEALWGAIGAGLKGLGAAAKAAKGVGAYRALGAGAKSAGRWAGQGISRGGALGKAQGTIGIQAGRAAKGLQSGLQGMKTAPMQTMWGGAKNFAAGATGLGGKGVGGNIGRAALIGSYLPTGG